MNSVNDSLVNHINWVDKFMDFRLLTGRSLSEWFVPLFSSITDDGAVPYLINTKERFRASPLSSTITWLSEAGLLSAEALEIMQDKLLFLRDNNNPSDADAGNRDKFVEDKNGWSLAEGVSVWSTSLAITALIDIRGIGIKKAEKFKDSVVWLAKQQSINKKGWAYQLHRNCRDNVIMTSLSLRALALALLNKSSFNFTSDEERQILTALNNGYSYLKETMVSQKARGFSYWRFNNTPHCAATTWALVALFEISKIDNINEDIAVFYNENIEGGLNFAISCMPKKISQWQDEQIVYEGGAKYNKQKNYYSFSSTLLLQLLSLGLSPYHPKVINQITWLINNPADWKIKGYDQGKICTFTYAMVISTIAKWAFCTGVCSVDLLKTPVKKREKFVALIFGMPVLHKSPVQLVHKSRLWWLLLLLIALLIFLTIGESIYFCIRESINYLLELWHVSSREIVINVLAYFICVALAGIGVLMINVIRKTFRI